MHLNFKIGKLNISDCYLKFFQTDANGHLDDNEFTEEQGEQNKIISF